MFGRPEDFLRDFDREIDEMTRMMDRMFSHLRRSDLADMPRGSPLYYGVSVNVGPDGIPHVQEFGNIRSGAQRLEAGGTREPFTTTVLDDDNHELRITAEMPGIEKKDVQVEMRDEDIHLRAKGEDREYEKTIPLNVPVDPESVKARYRNGVLEVTLRLKEDAPKKGRSVEVE